MLAAGRILLIFLGILRSSSAIPDVLEAASGDLVAGDLTSVTGPPANEASRKASAVLQAIETLPSYPPVTDPILEATSSVPEITESRYGVQEASASRDKRSLTFPDPSTILLIFGLGTPLQLDRESIIVGAFTKLIYNLPLNSTDFTEPGVYFSRTKSRWSIYKVLERAAELYGFGAGKGCLLRAICDVAAAPFDLRHGLFGQMAQAFLTPSSTSEAYDEYGDREYHAAERLGRNADENCHVIYPECDRSLLDVFSTTGTYGTNDRVNVKNPVDDRRE